MKNKMKEKIASVNLKADLLCGRSRRMAARMTALAIMGAVFALAMMGTTAFAADAMWSSVSNEITRWVSRMGGGVMFVGGVMFGLGWKSDDAEQKSRGINTIIAGGIVIGVTALAGTFFA